MTILESLHKRLSGETVSAPSPGPLDLLLNHELSVSEADARLRTREGKGVDHLLGVVEQIAEIGVFERDLRSGEGWWSPGIVKLLGGDSGRRRSDSLDGAMAEIFAADAPALRAALEHTAATGEGGSIECRFESDGKLRYAEIRFEAMEENGTPIGYRGTMQDITARTEQEMTADQELRIRARLLDIVDAAVIATDRKGRVTHWNAAAERMYGWTPEEALHRPIQELTGSGDPEVAARAIKSIRATGHWEGERKVPRRDGSRIPAFVRLAEIEDRDGVPAGVVGVSVDIGDRVAMENDLRGARDYLQAVTASMAEGLITLDAQGHLAYMNDAADALLGWREEGLLGEPLSALAKHRPSAISGDWEQGFAVDDLKQGDPPRRVDSEFIVGRDHTEIEISYTAAPFDSKLGEQGTVIVFADVTEKRGIERIAREKLEGLSWIGKIRDSLDSERLVPFAQPIVSLATGENVRYELLVRMLSDKDEPISPGRFLPIAEEFGLIIEIDELMVRRAAEIAARGIRVNVNLSAQSVAKAGMSDYIGTEIARAGADPSLIAVELTETALITSEHAARRFVERLAELGCDFALDDFGTGYGGFMYLKQLPIDYLKIDMEFVHDLTTNEGSQRVVRAVVDLAKGFGQQTIAEGIEDEETREILAEMGVDYGQGYLFGRPAPVDEVLETTNEEKDDA